MAVSDLGERITERAGCGLRVEPDDADALAGAVRWCTAHRDELRRMGANGRRLARELEDVQSAMATTVVRKQWLAGNHELMQRYVDALAISDEQRHAIFEGNARRVFPRLDARLKERGR